MRYVWMREMSAVVFLLLSACGGSGGGAADSPSGDSSTSQEYFPLPSNALWVYKLDDGSSVHVAALGSVQTAQGPGTQLVTTDEAGHPLDQSVAVATNTGVTAYPFDNASQFEQNVGPLKLLAFPAQAGQSFTQLNKTFTADFDVDGDGVNDQVTLQSTVLVVGYEDIDTPAGRTANTLHVRTDMHETVVASSSKRALSYRSVVDDWYAPGIGLVRSVEIGYANGVTARPPATMTLAAYRVGDLRSERMPPTVSATAPSSVTRATTADVAVTFSERVDASTLATGWRVVDANGTLLSGHVTMTGTTAHFVPDDGWHNGDYTAALTTAVTDLIGNPLAQAVTWQFTLDAASPVVVSSTPANAASNVPSTTPIVIQFSEPIDPASLNANTVRVSDGVNALATTVSISGATLTVTPSAAWPRQKTIFVSVDSAADVAGNPMATGYLMNFLSDSGEFDYPQNLAPALGTQAVAIADLDGDGFSDFVFTPSVGNSRTVYARYGRAGGTLADPVPLVASDVSTCSLDGLNVADLDGDGRNDVVVGSVWCGWRVLRQAGPRSFVIGEQLNYATDGPLRIADIDGDGRPELVGLSSNFYGVQLFVWRQDSAHLFPAAPTRVQLPVTLNRSRLYIADLDGDGRPDLLVTGTGSTHEDTSVLRQQPDGSFVLTQLLKTGEGNASGLAVGDVDGDGRPDVVITGGGNSPVYVAVFHQQADQSFGPPDHLSSLDIPTAVVLADLNGDGRQDVVVMHSGWGHVGTFLQQANGTLSPESLYASAYGSGDEAALAVGDLNADGRPDIVFDGQLLRQRTPESGAATALQVPGAARGARIQQFYKAAPQRAGVSE